ncbi:MAG: hypothetical protein IJP11_01900 [Oscillospiraceae bacterium]|nr:hypothetical protein [Oscillospiraceae bacterium]
MKYLLPPVENYYKASLHTHSTVSDGKMTPEEVKAHYKAAGFSILALTDHHIVAAHPQLNDPDFLTLTAIELGLDSEDYAPPASFFGQTYHFNLIAKDPGNLWQPYPPKKITDRNRRQAEAAHWDQRERICSAECANEILQRAKEEGFLAIYNHPTWSKQRYPDYAPLKGLWALEIRNTHNVLNGFDDNNHRVYQDLLELGNRLAVVACDDTHRPHTVGGSWTMIGAKELTYPAVIEAMERGDLYATCGPAIHSLTLDGEMLKITCDPAVQITVQTQARFAKRVAGDDITEGEFDLSVWLQKSAGDPNAFFRLTVTAADGTYAATRAYFLDEL